MDFMTVVCPDCDLIVEPYAPQVLNDQQILHEHCAHKRERMKHLRELLMTVSKKALRVESHRLRKRGGEWPSWTMHFDTEC